MEALQANITSSCPAAFSGNTGNLFAAAVATLVTAHCGIFDDYKWPKDDYEYVIKNPELAFDFIIVGAGTAGSLLASELSRIHSWSALLIEAGQDPGLDSEIPAFLFLNQNSSLDWYYTTNPDNNQSCLGFINKTCIWSKGKGLGGSSSLNAMLYIRGHPTDFNKWTEAGNPGWSYKDLRPYFEDIESKFNLNEYKYPENEWYNIIHNAYEELGFRSTTNNSNEAEIGTRITKLLVKNGKRLNTAKFFLNTSHNLHIMKNTVVQKVIIDLETKIATGVEIRHANGHVMKIKAKKEVILSAGSVATPQILILSGVGPIEHLKQLQIKSIANLPVGKNLQDHILLPLFLKTKLKLTLDPNVLTMLLLQYMLTKTGPFTNIGLTDFMGFISTKENAVPDMQFHHTYFSKDDNFVLKPYLEGLGYGTEIKEEVLKLNRQTDFLGIYPTLMYPKSKGEILLSDIDINVKPIIKTNYLNHLDDIHIMIEAINFVRKLELTASFQKLGIELTKLDIKACKDGDSEEAYWECYIRHMATTIYHPVGTAKMGPIEDPDSVVDSNLYVHGVKNLRVVDASVMPTIIGGNTMAATLVIAAKAFDMIKKWYDKRDEL